MKEIKLPEINCSQVKNEIADFIIRQMLKFNARGGVIGLSGGVDSTTAALLTKYAIDQHNQKTGSEFTLHGLIMPSKTNAQADEDDGIAVAEKIGITYQIISIEPIVETHLKLIPEIKEAIYHKGNMMSRIRANLLSTIGAIRNSIIIGTGNKDEDFGIGYYTLFGDGAVHISPLGNLSKRLVRILAIDFGFSDIASRTPTAGLEPGQTDYKDLGYTYEFVELISEGISQGLSDDEITNNDQVLTLAQLQLDEYEKTFNKKIYKNTDEVIADVFRRHRHSAIPKAQLISPPIPNITLKYD